MRPSLVLDSQRPGSVDDSSKVPRPSTLSSTWLARVRVGVRVGVWGWGSGLGLGLGVGCEPLGRGGVAEVAASDLRQRARRAQPGAHPEVVEPCCEGGTQLCIVLGRAARQRR